MTTAERTPLSPKRLKTAALKRERFLYAGMRCIRKLGIRKCTMDEFAAEAGVTRVTLYREFGSRAELVRAVIAHRSAAFNRRFASKTEHIIDFVPKLEAFLIASMHIARRNPVTREIIHGPIDFTARGSPMHKISYDLWQPVLQRAKDDGTLAETMDFSAAAEWILMMQAFFSRLAADSTTSFSDLHALVRTFVLPAFMSSAFLGEPLPPATPDRDSSDR